MDTVFSTNGDSKDAVGNVRISCSSDCQMNSISSTDKNLHTRCRKVKNDASDASPPPPSPSGQTVTEGSDYDENPAESDTEVSGLAQYVRLKEEQHVEAVVILNNGFKKDDMGGSGEMEAFLKSNGKLKFNLRPEQLGSITGCSDTTDGTGIQRKSSFRRNYLFSNQSDLEKQLAMERPKPVPEPVGMFTVPKRILMPMFSEDQDFVDLNNFYDKKSQLKFDEIL